MYFEERAPPGYTGTASGTKWTFTCPQKHTHTISKSTFQTRLKGVKDGKYAVFCSICEKDLKKDTSFNKWKDICTEKGFTFQSYDPSTRKIVYLCVCGTLVESIDSNMRKTKGCKKCSQVKFRLKIEDIREIFKEQGCELLSETYTNNKELLKYKCNCGNIATIILNDFKRDRRCSSCKVERSEATCMKKYNYKNPGMVPEFKDKGIETNME